jgi:hypothetical protein
MINLFYEVAEQCVHQYGSKYIAEYDVNLTAPDNNLRLKYMSERIWKQDTDGVRFIKHRWLEPATAEVDMEEFTLVVLKSNAL